MKKQNKSKYAIMGMLSLRPMSGYDIKKLIGQSIGYFWNESFGQIYPTLKRLVEEGLATQETEQQKNKRDRHIYALTPKGRAALRTWLKEPAEPETIRNELLLKLFFGAQVSPEDHIALIHQYRKRLDAEMQLCLSLEKALDEAAKGPPNSNLPYWRITVNYGVHNVQAAISWCNECVSQLKGLVNTRKETEE